MAYTETTTRSYGQRLTASFRSVGSGLLLFIAGTALLFWNEGNFVKTRKVINEAQGEVIKVDDVGALNADLNAKLIHSVAKALTADTLRDETFGVAVNAVKLSRKVEYYQWVEKSELKTRDKIGGGEETVTTYTYEKRWCNKPVESEDFHDPAYRNKNSQLTVLDDREQVATLVTWGAYKLPPFLTNVIGGTTATPVYMSDDTKAKWEKSLSQNAQSPTLAGAVAQTVVDSIFKTEAEYVHVQGNTVYFGRKPDAPEAGDLRITFTCVPAGGDLSIIAQVQGNTFTPYVAKNGKTFSSVSNGAVSAEQMFAGEHKSNSMWTWIWRIVGWLLVTGGLRGMFGILPALFKMLPFLGNIVGAGVGLVYKVFGFVWSLLIVAVSWLFYRPVIGVALFAVAVAGIVYLRKKSKRRV
jgi:hypothetical protein